MATGLLGKVYDQVKTITADANQNVTDGTALASYVASNYNSDQQLTQLVDTINADIATTLQDVLVLTTNTVVPPVKATAKK